MIDTINIKEEFIDLIKEKYKEEITVKGLMIYLFDKGILTEQRIKKALVRNKYYKVLIENNNKVNSAKLDTAVTYDVSVSYVDQVIYYYKEISL